jgi:putative ABC transport system ATP-binding protein
MIPTSEGAAVRAEQVSRHYQMGSAEIRALDDVTLEIRTGEFLALLGSSSFDASANSAIA